ncbi:hypothetical protein QOL99_15400 [Deinococcus sp. MIMF12]|uniref:Uncharacterized protein n=1 Tax=Deinococcus rhizophilus TaxID=3049544 RepID=A0ABT7JKE4_9DEIO|nr:hypothetical protein [Deinococcus rhizophilus]MDL2345524.1 hypothetical protein [Deinococcus rhizophilus]
MNNAGIRVVPLEPIDLIALSDQETITIEDIRRAAWAVNGTEAGVYYFMTHRHAVFGDRTVAEAVEIGQARIVLGALLNAAGI